ncbi:hypothetical protein, partial [Faecalibaculum rodentium]|uniref:hypothetical protein n=1 Tax=Faecalibaculum rodentium TaxID=1702221 RepID=UPI0025A249CC
RGCGDKLYTWTPSLTTRGSPPRMRGQVGRDDLICSGDRITPADAGTSKSLLNILSPFAFRKVVAA